jgi:hypothetical protein
MTADVPSGAAEAGAAQSNPAVATEPGCDALCVQVRAELGNFTGWLRTNGVPGYAGEVGWPDDRRGDGAAWSALAEAWYRAPTPPGSGPRRGPPVSGGGRVTR